MIDSAVAAADVQAFITAQDELRANVGAVVTMQTPVDPVWPDGTRINPDTNEPYSAMVQRVNAPYDETTLKALVIVKAGSPTRPQADDRWVQAGLMSGMDIILDVSDEDYERAKDASDFIVMADRFSVEEWKPFELGGIVYRYLLYGQSEDTRGGTDG